MSSKVIMQKTKQEQYPYEWVLCPIETGNEIKTATEHDMFKPYIRCQHCYYPVYDTQIRGHFNKCIYSMSM